MEECQVWDDHEFSVHAALSALNNVAVPENSFCTQVKPRETF